MNESPRRRYISPVRAAQARETRERILAAVAAWLQGSPSGEFTLDTVARQAGVERRTVFRHFPTKEALLDAFWVWTNRRLHPRALPASLDDLIAGPREVFPEFDRQEGVIRASLHTATGRAMRLAALPARRRAFRAALRPVTAGLSAAERRRLEALAHLLYSAAAWETMCDYAGLTGKQAGEAASWALACLAAAPRAAPRSPSPTPQSNGGS